MTAATKSPAQGRQTKSRRASNRLYERFNAILTKLVDCWRELVAVSLIGIDFYIMLRTAAFIAGVAKGWW